MIFWFLAIFLIPIIASVLLVILLGEDFLQLIRLQISFSRLFGDLLHILAILFIALAAEIFVVFHLVTQFL